MDPEPASVEDTKELIRMAQAVKNSLWYRMQRDRLTQGENPTLAIVLALVDRLAIYSARDRTPDSRD